MNSLFEMLMPEAQEALIRDNIITIVTILVEAIPDPNQPRDNSALEIRHTINHNFRGGSSRIETGIKSLHEICRNAEQDLSPAVREALHGALSQRSKDLDKIRQETIGGDPITSLAESETGGFLRLTILEEKPRIAVWCHGWVVALEDNGTILIDIDKPFVFENIDEGSNVLIRERIVRVNDVIGKIVATGIHGEIWKDFTK